MDILGIGCIFNGVRIRFFVCNIEQDTESARDVAIRMQVGYSLV